MTNEIGEEQVWQATAALHHAYFTGMVLGAVARRSPSDAAEFLRTVFVRQREAKFLDGLTKLGLADLPDAVAAAQYHYLSNHIGGVHVQYIYESDRKAWIRYVPPRWAWEGTALCGVPGEVSAAMLEGWHAQNGVSLGNPRLGFVCTQQTAEGGDALEGYYYEYDHELAPQERLRFSRAERGPDFDPAAAPSLPTVTWPAKRLAKAQLNYALEYVRTALPTVLDLWGTEIGSNFIRLIGKLVGMQYYRDIASIAGIKPDGSQQQLEQLLEQISLAQGSVFDAPGTGAGWEGIREGCAVAHRAAAQ
ncbi:MAG: hypothetical protein ABI137_14105 [Antricoccus sp.]